MAKADLRSRLFAGVYPAGIVYCDKAHEEHGDYKRVAFLPYESLKLEVSAPRSPLLPLIREDAAKIQARRGEQFQVSTCGQTVLLGGPLPVTLCAEFRAKLAEVGRKCGKTPDQVYALWRKYAADCSAGDQSPAWPEFLEWYAPQLAPAVPGVREYAESLTDATAGDSGAGRAIPARGEDCACTNLGYEDALCPTE